MQLKESDDFAAIKNSLIDRLVLAILAVISFALAGSFYRIVEVGLQPVMVVQVIAAVLFLLIYLFRNQLSAKHKASFMVGITFIGGIGGLLNFGLNGAGTIIMFSAAILAGLVLTTKIAIAIVALGVVTQFSTFIAASYGYMLQPLDSSDYALSLPAWINNSMAFVLLSAVCLFVIDKFFTYLKTMSAVLQSAVEEKHKELEHSEILLSTVINSLPFGVFWKKKDLTFWGANERFLADAGVFDVHQLLGKLDEDIASSEDTKKFLREDMEVLHSGVPQMGIVEKNESEFGKITYTLTNKVPLRDKQGEVIGVLGSYEDVTEQQNMEAALRDAIKEAQLASKAKSEFLATMSHEIRTPINGVMGLLELTLDTDLKPQQREYLNKANLSAKTLLQIINQILDISKIEAGKMELELVPFKVCDVLLQVEQQLSHLAQNKGLEFSIEAKGPVKEDVQGDPTKLLQILVNLTSNAIKFTETGFVKLEVGALKQKDALNLRIVVKDSGIGISAEQQEKLFQSFTQADSSTARRFGGTGLGLTIVKQLLDMQQGRIELNSELGQGTCFTCFIAYEYAQQRTQRTSTSDYSALVGKRILLAEDNDINQVIASEMLSQAGMLVDIADDGEVALKKLDERQFDLVLMDIQMPNMDGITAFEHMRKGLYSELPVIALTANVLAHEVAHYHELGFRAHIGKPFQKEQLLSKILQVFSSPEY